MNPNDCPIPELMKNPKVAKLMADLIVELTPLVVEIEALPATTRNHYDKYMSCLSACTTPVTARLSAIALVKAGANRDGVFDAFHALWGEDA